MTGYYEDRHDQPIEPPADMEQKRLSYAELGKIMLQSHGGEACQQGYGTTDPEWVGRYALQYGDINADGTMN